MLLEFIV